MSASTHKQVLILGGGFSELYTALGLEKTLARDSVVNRENFSYPSDYKPLLEEQLLRLQSLVAYLLEKNEQLRQTVAAQCEKG